MRRDELAFFAVAQRLLLPLLVALMSDGVVGPAHVEDVQWTDEQKAMMTRAGEQVVQRVTHSAHSCHRPSKWESTPLHAAISAAPFVCASCMNALLLK